MDFSQTTIVELAAIVAEHLHNKGMSESCLEVPFRPRVSHGDSGSSSQAVHSSYPTLCNSCNSGGYIA